MSSGVSVVRAIAIYGICLPLAVCLGYLLSNPFDLTTFATVGLLFLVLAIPILLNWHHPLAVLCWNTSAVMAFIPGRPKLWLTMVAASFLISVLQKIVNKRTRLVNVPMVTWPLLFLLATILITARLTGGIGLKAFGGSSWGGQRYIYLIGAILGYFALSWHRIPIERAPLYVGMFFLGGLTWAISNTVNLLGPSFYFIFAFFPVEALPGQITSGESFITRMQGVPLAALAVFCYLIARYGIQGIFTLNKLWRLGLFILSLVLILWGGFRSLMISIVLIFLAQFFLEGVHRTRLVTGFVLGGLLGLIVILPLLPRMPPNVQRCFAWLPVEIDPMVRLNAEQSSEWRLQIWRAALPQIPKHLLLGKGYAMDRATITDLTTFRGFTDHVEGRLATGDYHNGPLSLVLPLGIWGVIGFVWFVVGSLKLLYRNYRFGNPALKSYNTLLLAMFIAYLIQFLFVFGYLQLDMHRFCGIVGLSVALNQGVSQPVLQPAEAKVAAPTLATILPRPRPSLGR